MKVPGMSTSLTGLVSGWEKFSGTLDGVPVAGDPRVARTRGPWSNLTWSTIAVLRFKGAEGRVHVGYEPQRGPTRVFRCPLDGDTCAMKVGREGVILGGVDEEGKSVPVEVVHRVRLYFPRGFHVWPYRIAICRVPLKRYFLVREGLLGERRTYASDDIVAVAAYPLERGRIMALDPDTGRAAPLTPILRTSLY